MYKKIYEAKAAALRCFKWQKPEDIVGVEEDEVTGTISIHFADGDVYYYGRRWQEAGGRPRGLPSCLVGGLRPREACLGRRPRPKASPPDPSFFAYFEYAKSEYAIPRNILNIQNFEYS